MAAPTNDPYAHREMVEPGMKCDLKNFYQLADARGRVSWTDQYPKDLLEVAENEATARFAILVRNKESFDDSRKKLEIDSIVVQSPLLKKALAKVLKEYPGVTLSLKRLEFKAPFHSFMHRWSEFSRAVVTETHEETKEHLILLYSILEIELKDVIPARDDYIENQVITFDNLWIIFKPGDTIYAHEWDRHCGRKFSGGKYIIHPKYGPCYSLSAQTVDWNGHRFGYAMSKHLIPAFSGTLPISQLDVFPLESHPNEMKIRAKLIKRGRIFEKYHGYHYQAYKAFALGKNQRGDDIKVTIDSRIIIDTFAFGEFNPNGVPPLAPLTTKSRADQVPEQYNDHELPVANETGVRMREESRRIPLTDEQLTHCATTVKGYALKTKKWLSFFVDEVKPIVWNSSAFSNLVLPPTQKELIRAFVSAQTKYKDNFDDVISGKGKGIIMLLSGGPGIGKTLTAESVAEDMKVPLYTMSASDLGVDSSEVESTLTTILEMVAKWNAVLLLDECDVFLEARSPHDLERNKIVSIFLRTLEYYEGILFLTTNQVKKMDPAFQSRIHIRLTYPSLTKSSRTQVWNNFLARGITHEISSTDISLLADVSINGREIKNVLKTAQLLSQHQGLPLRYGHLKTVLDIEQGFGETKEDSDEEY